MNEEIKNTVNEVVKPVIDTVEVTDVMSSNGVPTAVKIVVGVAVGVAGLVGAAVFYKKRKDKTALNKPDGDVEVTEAQVREVVETK